MSKIKLLILLTLCTIFVSVDQSFADNSVSCFNGDSLEDISVIINFFLNLLARIRIPIATIAGKLMTNSIVYGEFLNMDKILYMLWNISRTFANFIAAGLILRAVVNGLLQGEIDQKALTKKVIKIGIGILVANMSRWMTGALLDISNISTLAISALPGTYFNADTSSQWTMLAATRMNSRRGKQTLDLTSWFCDFTKTVTSEPRWWAGTATTEPSDQELLDSLLPKNDSVAWPLIYIWSSVIKIQQFIFTNNSTGSLSDHLMILVIRIAITMTFFMSILILLVINVFRIIYLWFFIAFAPILVLLYLDDSEDSVNKKVEGLLPGFSIANMIRIIFAPVVVVWLLSIVMIVVVLVQQLLQSNNSYVQIGDTITIQQKANDISSLWSEWVFMTEVQWNVLYNETANTFSDLLLLWITLVLLWSVTSIIVKYNNGVWWEAVENIASLGKSLLSNIPIIPVWDWKRVWVWSAWNSTFGRNGLASQIKWGFESKSRENEENITNKINEKFGLPGILTAKEYKGFTDHAKKIAALNRDITSTEVSDFTKLFKESIASHYQNPNNKKTKTPLKNMEGMSEYLPTLLQKIIKAKDTYPDLNARNLEVWLTDDTIESYINKNYTKNKDFFNTLYANLWWNPKKLNNALSGKAGEIFRNKPLWEETKTE